MFARNQICLVIGTPRGFTRSVLEALLKRGSRVILACPDPVLCHSEHRRLSELYGASQLSVNVVEGCDTKKLESVLIRALDTHGDINTIINSTSDSKLKVSSDELRGRFEDVEVYLNRKQLDNEVQSIKRISKLAVKYLGIHNGFQGGSLLNLVTRTELSAINKSAAVTASQKQQQQFVKNKKSINMLGASSLPLSATVPLNTTAVSSCCGASNSGDNSCCTVLGTTRALGISKQVAKHGVRTMSVYQPNIDYPDLSPANQITDDEHSPYYTWSRYSAYCREYSGYMALHLADTASSGTAWRFNQDLRLEQVKPSDIPNSCKLTNKMCYWLGCPHVAEEDLNQPSHLHGIRNEQDENENLTNGDFGFIEEDN
eukprot:TRINITY_DN10216_c0_g1_i4.p1 TRINITY_DN10216_c0_g1~~TRINITY_DN10216_c0_g1_i4.p1  ORF type:complete len:372 (-),score=69.11 TRINITY_DN10216_c0_g1_i4:573-1688(-)